MGDDSRFQDIFHQLDRNHEVMDTVFKKLDDLMKITVENTVVLKAHHARSTKLEDICVEMDKRAAQVTLQIAGYKHEVALVHADLERINKHVDKLHWFVVFLDSIPVLLKITAAILTILSAGLGAYYTYVYLLR